MFEVFKHPTCLADLKMPDSQVEMISDDYSLVILSLINIYIILTTLIFAGILIWIGILEFQKGRKQFKYLQQLTNIQHEWLLDSVYQLKWWGKNQKSIEKKVEQSQIIAFNEYHSFSNFSNSRYFSDTNKFHVINSSLMIRISLVDDHKLFRSGIKALLSTYKGFEVVSESDNGKAFIETVAEIKPDVVLMDLEMPEMDGMETTKFLKVHFPDVKVIMISMHDDEKFIVHMMDLGARGYLLKNAEPEDILTAVNSVVDTGYYFSDLVSRAMLQGLTKGGKVKPSFKPGNDLTEREMEVLQLICREKTAAEIGEELFISPRTVEGHRNNIILKTGARNTAGIVVFAMKNGLFEL